MATPALGYATTTTLPKRGVVGARDCASSDIDLWCRPSKILHVLPHFPHADPFKICEKNTVSVALQPIFASSGPHSELLQSPFYEIREVH